MSGFVRGGPADRDASDRERTAIVATEWTREVVEVTDTDPRILHLVEPVVVGERDDDLDVVLVEADLGVTVAELVDGVVPPNQLPPPKPVARVVGVTTPTLLVQIAHGLGYDPAGVIALDTLGVQTECDAVSYPTAGHLMEISFGAEFTGTIRVS